MRRKMRNWGKLERNTELNKYRNKMKEVKQILLLVVLVTILGIISPSKTQAVVANGPIMENYGISAPATVGTYKTFGPGGVLISPDDSGSVAGVSTDASGATTQTAGSCMNRFTSYAMTDGGNASPEAIIDIQRFLNQEVDAGLEINGIYDENTIIAVRVFQVLHSDEVLTPWGISEPTGNFYLTTARAANMINCSNQGQVASIPMPTLIPYSVYQA